MKGSGAAARSAEYVPPYKIDPDELFDVYGARSSERPRRAREASSLRSPSAAIDAAATWRTLAEVPDDPPEPLLFGLLEPDGPSLMYAAPGTGKGTTGAWLVVQALNLGMTPLIFDAERRPREWARRVSGLGGDRSRVIYLEPPDLGQAYVGRPLWEAASALAPVIHATGADLVIVDSILPAVGVGEDRLRNDAQVPYLYVSALDALGIPSLSFGHPPKGRPEGDPFGSFAWVAAMRLTWLGTAGEGEGHRIRWRPRKRNERGHVPGVLLTIEYGDDGRPSSVKREDDEDSSREWLLLALKGGPRKVAGLAEQLIGDSEKLTLQDLDRVKERLSQALLRLRRAGLVERVGTSGPGVRWRLAEES